MFEALWLISGLAGAALIWRLFKLIERHAANFTWCPSPLGIFFALVGSIFGPIILAAGIIVTGILALEEIDFENSWLTRPICKRRAPTISSTTQNTTAD